MSKKLSNGDAKTLSDTDIATYARRAGPTSGAHDTDSDAHSESDAPSIATDHDTAAASNSDT